MDFLNVLPLVVAESNAGAAIGALIGGLISLACSLLVLVAYWKLFVKMGEPGWHCIIPILNTWDLFKHVFGNGWMMLTMLIPGVNGIISLMLLWKLYKGFGKGTGFCVLGLFFAPIALLICAFDGSAFIDQR